MKKEVLTRNRLLKAFIAFFVMAGLALSVLAFTPKTAAAEPISIWNGSVATAFSGGDGDVAHLS